ncbi:glycosyl hydrolase [Siphonobacter sp. SORGH_AS_0500]|uniref:sialidase family protein n=1 Tax=Siphonobacter sp. SORGH_AS_0500 TaxID=1864824 RepID=UPI000CBAE844|nr:sialidase family protein [Siphonobacter sp. SORGH_AS_0500]PKK37437.1 glycosyl hydrolase [Siphonobacter sp. SORGH_AS_0500]
MTKIAQFYVCFWLTITGCLGQEPVVFNEQTGKITATGAWIPQNVDEMKGLLMGPFIRNSDGHMVAIEGQNCMISKDEGKTWQPYPLFAKPEKFNISGERAMLKTRSGVLIFAFLNLAERSGWKWDRTLSDTPGAILPTYAMRSLDGGRTWQEPKRLHTEHTGAIRSMIETRDGNVIFTSMMMRHNPGHHTVLTYTTRDDGQTWERSNIIDMGGIGDHSGVTESTIEQLKDGRIWQLMRTNWGTFWEAFSDNEGITWTTIRPTSIDASSAPGQLKRLASGKLVLLWNRRFPEGKTTYPFRGGDRQFSEVAASNYREELSIAFSDDDGKSWSKPKVIAKSYTIQNRDTGKAWIAYPYIFEVSPGRLWVTTMQGDLRIAFNEVDFY